MSSRMSSKNGSTPGIKKALVTLAVIACFWWAFGAASANADSMLVLMGNVSSNPTDNGYYVGAYPISVDGTPTRLVCDDATKDIGGGATWNAQVNTFATLSQTKFFSGPFGDGIIDPATAYKEVFWLTSQMQSNSSEVGPIHFAIWSIMDPDVNVNSYADAAAINRWLSLAGDMGPSVNTSSYLIYTPDPACSSQEFIGSVPVPPSILLFAPGLLGIVGLRRRAAKK